MKARVASQSERELIALCTVVKAYARMGEYEKCEALICNAMRQFPSAPEPHNLFGALLEIKGDHVEAMKHFRAALALDPTYLPARENLGRCGTFFAQGKCAFDVSDCERGSSNDSLRIIGCA